MKGKKKIWSITYADDVALVANDENELEGMMKTNKSFLKRKSLELNVVK